MSLWSNKNRWDAFYKSSTCSIGIVIDLKNPIGAASLCAEMLLEDPAIRNLGAEACDSTKLIKRNIDTSLRLIADLLDMERIEGGKLVLTSKSYEIGQMIREVGENFKQVAILKSVDLTAPADVIGEVVLDKDRIVQVLSNLIGNALKFTPAGGAVRSLLSQPSIMRRWKFLCAIPGQAFPKKSAIKYLSDTPSLGSMIESDWA